MRACIMSCIVYVARLFLYYFAHSLNSVESGGHSVWASMSLSCPQALADPELELTSPNGWEPAWTGCKIGLGHQARPSPGRGLQGCPIPFWNGQTLVHQKSWWQQGCIIRSILLSGMGARGISLEHVENMKIFSCSPRIGSLHLLMFK